MNKQTQVLVGTVLILAAAFSRLIPHPMNFAPITAIALFGGMYFDKRIAPVLPLAALIISDYFLGMYSGIIWVYSAFLLVTFLGMAASNKRSVGIVAGSTVLGSVLFFIITNFGVWQSGEFYPMTMSGLTACYVAAIPFFRNALVGDLFYVTVLFASYEFAKKMFPSPDSVNA
ncbi:MAG: DUF6580 family putative transport protein [Bacteroidota bacterium]